MRNFGIQREAPLRARFAVSFNRLQLFKNSEEVKRIWFSQTRFVWVRDCISERRGFSRLWCSPSAPVILCLAPSRAQGYRVK
jgi:hypothetical protein